MTACLQENRGPAADEAIRWQSKHQAERTTTTSCHRESGGNPSPTTRDLDTARQAEASVGILPFV